MATTLRIGELLVRAGVVTFEQLDDALRQQVVHGGRIGTNLIELYQLDLDVLAKYLGQQHTMPAALEKHFVNCDRTIQERMPGELAAQWFAIPIGLISKGPAEHIAVAVRDPLPDAAKRDIAAALGRPIMAAVASELRIFYYLEDVYGYERPNRFKRVRPDESIDVPIFFEEPEEEDDEEGKITAERPAVRSGRERRHFIETLSADPSGDGVLARVAIKKAKRTSYQGERAPTTDLADLDDAIRVIRRATGRDAIGDVIIDCLREGFDSRLQVGMVLVVRAGVAVGWKGFVRDGDDGSIELLAIPLSAPSAIAFAYQLQAPHVGAPTEGSIIEKRLFQALNVPVPHQVVAVPVTLMGQIVCLIYGQTGAGQTIEPAHTEDLARLAKTVGLAFKRLTRAAQR